MEVNFKIPYSTVFGEEIYVCGSVPELGDWDEGKAFRLSYTSDSQWSGKLNIQNIDKIRYRYILRRGQDTIRKEWGEPRELDLIPDKTYYLEDLWINQPQQEFLYTSAFSDSFFVNENQESLSYFNDTIVLKVQCPFIAKGQILILTGESQQFGEWDIHKASHFSPSSIYGIWQIAIDASLLKRPVPYKLAIYDTNIQQVVHWEIGWNRFLNPLAPHQDRQIVRIETIPYNYGWLNWKAAGVAIPVFSLRTNTSFGIGEFSDLRKMIDWAKETGQKIIQVLPVNDTTINHTWADSYPYNAISIYALHPLYLGLSDFPLKNKDLYADYLKNADLLNSLVDLDYEKVQALKWAYFSDLFLEMGEEVLKTDGFNTFFQKNKDWLLPYACFSYLRDKHQTPNYSLWGEYAVYNREQLEHLVEMEPAMEKAVNMLLFIQYLLHVQLSGVKKYAHEKGIVIKGDIPIGISRYSVEAWVEPHLFNLDTQTGAPPDDFSINGQNWSFPTYNWSEMAKDGFQWWIKRFRKMSDYFDAYRIDHILGFFRIWEIPIDSVQGLLGYFSPALPYTVEDIHARGMWFDEFRMTTPFIHENFLGDFFGEYAQEVINEYLNPVGWQRYELKEYCNSQQKIKELFEGKNDEKSIRIWNGLYGLCNEVLFVKDKREPHKYHPRITAQYTYSYRDLDEGSKAAFNRLYDEFFYHRHNDFWRQQAMEKLPSLISATRMLVCGEDLGMIPDCVPSVMNDLQILSLEIERMPKEVNRLFENLSTIPYRCVCTTSTHDMAPIRAWWREDREITQKYYNEALWRQGEAPEECTAELCHQILLNHLKSPAVLVILPLQDWLSIDDHLRRENPDEERINIPSNPRHYWRYRMHLTVEQLLEANDFNTTVRQMILESGRD